MKCCRPRPKNLYREPSQSHNSQKKCLYILLCIASTSLLTFFLRDTTPVLFVKPSISDMNFETDTVDSTKINDAFWRVSIRHINTLLSSVCQDENYMVLTNKNIESDNVRMKDNYIYFCHPISEIQAMVNGRVVHSDISTQTIRCKETYSSKTKTLIRHFPFSLKYTDAVDFSYKTKIIRDGIAACTILHAIDIVNSVWD